ncbi:unnamed protein product [Cuscuta campestris]|uniref:Cdc23 domain-containing protein n=1 Tax=Cuscuta campestris TaxID=132261 RepID=A0A484KXM7_9ASTE|nr:unnamed protein product [Cuscuta campestris]
MEAILVDCVQNSLRHFMHRNAIFMCERLCAEFPSETNMQLLATCYLQNNQAYAAYHILKGTHMAQSRYLFALSCFQMDLLNEAEMTLSHTNDPTLEVPNGASGHYLLGLIYRYTDRKKSAVLHFKKALLLDPLLWAAYEELCILGTAEEAASVFGEASSLCVQNQHAYHGSQFQTLSTSIDDHILASNRSFASEDASPRQLRNIHINNSREITGNSNGLVVGGVSSQPFVGGSASAVFCNTPSPMVSQISGVAPPPICRNAQQNGVHPSVPGGDNSLRSSVNSIVQPPRRKFVDEGKLRKISGRLFSDSGSRRNSRLAGDSTSNSSSTASTSSGIGLSHSSKFLGSSKLSSMTLRSMTTRKAQSWATDNLDEVRDVCDDSQLNIRTVSPSGDGIPIEHEGVVRCPSINTTGTNVLSGASEIMALLRILGEGFRFSCLYRCRDALDMYNKLPHKHYNTGWVLSQVGKAYFEMVDYLEADRAFSLARLTAPYNLEGLDVYSTVLYHLKEDMKLSYLAQELVSTDRLAPQSWCAMGNCYSSQKDHETALRNLQRAVQLNSRFAYAHTLCGHEYVAVDDFENGISSYQRALKMDDRHYKAWYGLGMVYLRQEKFEFAEHHFRRALQINPHSSVIMSYLGTALHAMKRHVEALDVMEKAIVADKKNPLPMYEKANILVSMEKFDAALEVLEELKEHAPRESSVYALMGRIYKRHNIHDKAMLYFGLALDMKPSATDVANIKAAIERLNVPDELEEDAL